jgi:TRAP-type mannitol/chloroaromatic compound transport system permease large subunit
MILFGATAFSLVFNELGGTDMVLEFFSEDIGNVWVFIAVSMLAIFILGFFIDFIEISFIIVPILVPVMDAFGIDSIWFAVLIALNLQASFLTPPFGLALFFLKGAASNMITTMQIYKGIVPFIVLQIIALVIVIAFPDLVFAFL